MKFELIYVEKGYQGDKPPELRMQEILGAFCVFNDYILCRSNLSNLFGKTRVLAFSSLKTGKNVSLHEKIMELEKVNIPSKENLVFQAKFRGLSTQVLTTRNLEFLDDLLNGFYLRRIFPPKKTVLSH